MRLQVISSIAALLLVAACETAPEETSDSTGSGSTAATSDSSTTSSAGTTSSSDTMASKTPMKPAGPMAGSQEDLVANVGDRVFFEFDSFAIGPRARGTLERQASWLNRYGNITLTIEGHCDERGTREYNLGLGQRRAEAVKKYLIALGVAENRLATISYGKERPVALGSNDQSWAQNRRGVARIN